MTEADALRQYPTATKVPGTMVIRDLPETEHEAYMGTTSASMARKAREAAGY